MTATSQAARGKVLRTEGDCIVFQPSNTNYELHLKAAGYNGPIGTPVDCTIRVNARKVYSVSSGGNFIQPIFGPPKIIQGRVISIEGQQIVMHAAGGSVVVTLPQDDRAIDLNSGGISPGSMVNVVAFAGGSGEVRG